ncbi:hypothetical protein BYT27DRAFT_7335105 [Phlegmacium glaucopus]|nr:hypothetical protein BYT27DRAFT_7335105 [Phlegmacium glaucopus]
MFLPQVSIGILTSEIWQRIAFYTIASQETFLGPPSDLYSLALVSRDIYNKIYRVNLSHLLARIFRFKFNVAAILRRLSMRWHTTTCLASELVKRFQALKRIKAKEFNPDDVWTCYLMMSENDGKNEKQLIDYAGLPAYLQSVIIYRSRPHDLAWYRNPTLDSLLVWIMWMTASRDQITSENPNFRQLVMGILQSFVVTAHRHSSVYGPDLYFNLPLCSGAEAFASIDVGPPPVSELIHYSHTLKISAPVATPAALLNYVLRIESMQTEATFPPHASSLPRNRADAIAQEFTGPTLEDIMDFHYENRIPTMNRCTTIIDTQFVEDLDEEELLLEHGSKRYDEDWNRLVGCQDLRISDTPLRGTVFKVGSMTGSWAGRFLVAFYLPMTSVLTGVELNPLNVSIAPKPLYWELQEHHCLIPNEPLQAGLDENSCDDILNAWLPRGLLFTHLEDGLEVYDPTTGKTARYETFVPRSEAPYSKSACDKLKTVWISSESDEEIADSGSLHSSEDPDRNLPSNSYIDDDERYVDTVCHLSSGVCDILITGKTGERYGDAWGHFTIHGRVRPWDGLVVLLRFPTDPGQEYLGKWIFKGYLHDQSFVGRWRETSTQINTIGYEGGFAVYKTDKL